MSMSSQPSPLSADSAFNPAPPPASAVRMVFLGPNGLRAGWRILIFIALFVGQGKVLNIVLHKIPAVVAMHKGLAGDVMTPGVLMFDEGLSVALLLLTAFWMTLIEKHTFADYYLPVKEAFGKRFWQGVPYTFSDAVVTDGDHRGAARIFHSRFRDGWRGCSEIRAALWDRVLLCRYGGRIPDAGIHAIHARIGDWLLAGGVSAVRLFGAGHIQNIGREDWFGAVMAGSFGTWRCSRFWHRQASGSAIGMHLGWDWGETFL